MRLLIVAQSKKKCDITPVACRGYVRPVQGYPAPAIRFTLGVGVREFRDSDDVLRILPFVVRHAQRRAHSKSTDAAGLRIPERAVVRKKCQADSNGAESTADQSFPLS